MPTFDTNPNPWSPWLSSGQKLNFQSDSWYWCWRSCKNWLLIVDNFVHYPGHLWVIYDIWFDMIYVIILNLDNCVHCPGHIGVIYLYLHMICDIFCNLYCNCNCVHLSRSPCWLLCPGHAGVGWSLHEGRSECQEEDRAWEWGTDQQIASSFYILNWSQN